MHMFFAVVVFFLFYGSVFDNLHYFHKRYVLIFINTRGKLQFLEL